VAPGEDECDAYFGVTFWSDEVLEVEEGADRPVGEIVAGRGHWVREEVDV